MTKKTNVKILSKPKVKLLGTDSNIFNLLGIADAALRAAGQTEKIEELHKKVTSSYSYDEALGYIRDYIDAV